ncbi:MAG: WD40 repeat domain-containing protein, partial [Desulfobacterales bacterium]|nr:WD40 repeat domain-containing protein [Desulfobacterales bacterium]
MHKLKFAFRILTVVFTILVISTPSLADEKPEIFVQFGHTRSITSVAFTPDGRFIVSGSRDETIKIWEASTGREIRTISGIGEDISSIAISPCGRYIISADEDYSENLKLWDMASGKKIKTFKGHKSNYGISVTFSPNGEYVISGDRDKNLKLWDIASGNEVRSFSGSTAGINSIAITPDGKYVVAGSRDYSGREKSSDSIIRVWDIARGEHVMACNTGKGWVSAIAISPDGKYFISGGSSDSASMWELSTGKQIKAFDTGGATRVSISPNGKYVLFGGYIKIELWDIMTGEKIKIFKGLYGSVRS